MRISAFLLPTLFLISAFLLIGCFPQNETIVQITSPPNSATEISSLTPLPTQTKAVPTAIPELSQTPTLILTEINELSPTATATPTLTFTPKLPTNTLEPNRTSTPTPLTTELLQSYDFPTVQSPHATLVYGENPIGQFVSTNGITVTRLNQTTLEIIRQDKIFLFDLQNFNTYGHFETFPLEFTSVYFSIFDLDANGESEIILEFIFVGAYASVVSTVIYYDQSIESYRNSQLAFDVLNPIDIDGDQLFEFYLRDTNFNLALGGAHAIASISPVHILAFRNDDLRNISSDFPEIVEADSIQWFDKNLVGSSHCDIFAWGAYLADMHLLNRGEEGWYFYEESCSLPADHPEYENILRQKKWILNALMKFGYLK